MDESSKARLNRLKWHCRRALLELDLMFERFWARHPEGLGDEDATVLESLLAMEDHELWALVSGRDKAADARQAALIERLRELTPAAKL